MSTVGPRHPRVVEAVKLQRSAVRRRTGAFLAEGANAVAAALGAGEIRELFCSEAGAAREPDIVARVAASGVPVTMVSERAAAALAETVTPPGLVAVCSLIDVPLERVFADPLATAQLSPRMVVVAVESADPGNAGSLLRLADGLGADAVVFAGEGVDPYNGKCVRAAAGSLFHVPIVRERNIDLVLTTLQTAGLTIVATTAEGELALEDADTVLASSTAWLFGNESHGLPPEVMARATHRIRIPIRGRAESLNLAAAAAICLYANARIRYR